MSLVAVDKRKSDIFDYTPLTQDVEKAAENKAATATAKIAAAKKKADEAADIVVENAPLG